jgi:hypothetical protein
MIKVYLDVERTIYLITFLGITIYRKVYTRERTDGRNC